MQLNVWGWNNIPIATVIIKFIDGRIVKFLHRCYSARRFNQNVSDLYKRRIAFKPLSLALIRATARLSPSTTRGVIPSRPSSSLISKVKYVFLRLCSGFPLDSSSKLGHPAKNGITANSSVSGLLAVVPTNLQMHILNAQSRGNCHLEFRD